jgi:hypothetical protein
MSDVWPPPEPGTHFGWVGTYDPKLGEHYTAIVADRRHGLAAELYAAWRRGYWVGVRVAVDAAYKYVND